MNDNIGVYAEAKGEYTRQLCQFLTPALLEYFLKVVEEAKLIDTDERKLLWNFQNLLKNFPDWNVDKVKRETDIVLELSKCDYLEELLTAVFIAHTKVLSAIRLTTKQKKVQLTIPKLDHFLHRTMADCARILWSNVYLFTPTGSSVERQKNLNRVEGLLNEAIQQSIRSMLPVKSILREYLHDDGGEDAEEVEEKEVEKPKEEVAKEAEKPKEEAKEEKPKEEAEKPKEEAEKPKEETEKPKEEAEKPKEETEKPKEVEKPKEEAETPKVAEAPKEAEAPKVVEAPVSPAPLVIAPPPTPAASPQQPQTIVVDTEPIVRFTNIDTIFDPNDLAKNVLQDMAMLDSNDEDEDDEDELKILDAGTSLQMDDDEFEEL
jgi:hypothetical protein